MLVLSRAGVRSSNYKIFRLGQVCFIVYFRSSKSVDMIISYLYNEKLISSRLFLSSCQLNDLKPDATFHLEPNTTRFVAVAAKTIRFFFLPRQTGKERSFFQRTIPHMTWNDPVIMQKALGSAGVHLSCGRRRTHVHVICVLCTCQFV